MSNENQDYTPLSTEVRGPENLIKLETKKSYKDKLKAKEIFETEIVAGRTYFDFNGQRYYIKQDAERIKGNELFDFREERKFYYLARGLMSNSAAEKMINENPSIFPPVAYKIKNITQGSKKIREVEPLTQKEDDALIECYENRIYDNEMIKKRLGIPKHIELLVGFCNSAIDVMENTAEGRATAEAKEWIEMKRVYYASGEKKDTPVYTTYDEFLTDKNSTDFSYAVGLAIKKNDIDAKKK